MKEKRFIITDLPDIASKFGKFAGKVRILHCEENTIEKLASSVSRIVPAQLVLYVHPEKLSRFRQEFLKEIVKRNLLIKIILNTSWEDNAFAESGLKEELFFGNLPENAPSQNFIKTFLNVFNILQLGYDKINLRQKINISSNELERLTQIGISLANERDFTKLLRDILNSAREIAAADSGSLYLVETDDDDQPVNLRFKISALDLDSNEFLLPINKKSIAGYVAATGNRLNLPDVYDLPHGSEFSFNSDFDKRNQYHSKSMLVVPMKNHLEEVVGVIQLINKKKRFDQVLTPEQMKGPDIFEFDSHTEELVSSLAGQAAVAIENNNLLKDIEALFEGFVKASVTAIEARDPTTSGHSFRVAEMTVRLAEIVDRAGTNKFKNIKFSPEQIREIRYASLLHDFGKVGVREKVLVKAKKLEDYEVDIMGWRFRYIQKDLDLRFANRRMEYLKKYGNTGFGDFEASLDMEYEMEKHKLLDILELVHAANEPTVLEESFSQKLASVTNATYTTSDGQSLNLITPHEFKFLSINKGSLDARERLEIESHVEHTFQFLSQIPWTGNLKMVPAIAHAHHEKLNGSGYPHGLASEQIPVQSKMMTISDIFDALTDQDRPYKKAVPLDRALDILKFEQKDNHIDADLLDIFISERVWDGILRKRD